MNTILCGREPISETTEARFRVFMQQLAEGKAPAPVDRQEVQRQFDNAADVPLSDEATAAISTEPFTKVELAVLVNCLTEHSVTQTKLAEWWGYRPSFFRYMRNGRKPIPRKAADRLRVLFGLPSLLPVISEMRPRELSKIPGTPAIAALFDSEPFGAAEIKAVFLYLRREYCIYQPKVAEWLGMSKSNLGAMAGGEHAVTIRSALRSIFAFAQDGGAE